MVSFTATAAVAAWCFCQGIEAATDGGLPAGASCNDASDLAPTLVSAKLVSTCNVLSSEHQDNALYQRRGFKHIDGTRQDDASSQRRPERRPGGVRTIDDHDSSAILH